MGPPVRPEADTLVLFGACGDLARKKLLPALYELTRQGVFYNRDFLKTIDGSGARLLEQHQAIGQAVLDQDEDRAAEAAEAHIDFVEQSFRLGLEQERREAMAEKRRLLAR